MFVCVGVPLLNSSTDRVMMNAFLQPLCWFRHLRASLILSIYVHILGCCIIASLLLDISSSPYGRGTAL